MNYLEKENDLTDRLTDLLTEYMPLAGGRNQIMNILKHSLWPQAGASMDNGVFDVIYESLSKYPVPVLAQAITKAVKYGEGKRKPANWFLKVLEDKASDDRNGG